MKSPYQIAKELNVSPQAVYKKLTSEFTDKLTNHIQRTPEGKYSLDEVAEKALKNRFNQVAQQMQQHTVESIEQQLLNQLNTENKFLRERIEVLEHEISKERDHSHEQADKLADLASQLAELTRNNQILLSTEQSRKNPSFLIDGKSSSQVMERPKKKNGILGLFKNKE